ncbi:MAG: hypothetical protein JST54_09765 [Deltaproteobacteria bacterium]|nr:hypothetical protein [Deltaproteobacteria bacterium]
MRTSITCLAVVILVGCGGASTPTHTSAGIGGSASGTSGGSSGSGSTSGNSSTGSSSSTTGSSTSTSTSTSSSSTGTSGATVAPSGCFTDVSAGHHQFSCEGGIRYDVEIPTACASGGCGLILDTHGFTMNADQEDLGTNMRALGKQNGYIVAQPTAPGAIPSWDPADTYGPPLLAFVQTAMTAMAVDPKRVHAMGFSQGGGMTWWLICGHTTLFASVAPISAGGVGGCTFIAPDAPAAELPVMQVHGHHDNIVNFDTTALPQRDAALGYWNDGTGTVIEQDAAHIATRYLSPSGTPFEFWEHDYQADSTILGGHCFPGGTDVGPLPDQFGCADANQFVVGQLAMQFFLAHPKP